MADALLTQAEERRVVLMDASGVQAQADAIVSSNLSDGSQ